MKEQVAHHTTVLRRLLLILAVSSVLPCGAARPGRAAVQEIQATGRYHLGDNDTRIDGHRLALMDAKRNALEKAGTYVESITEVKDFQLTRDDIRTYTAGIIAVEASSPDSFSRSSSARQSTISKSARDCNASSTTCTFSSTSSEQVE